MAKTYTYTWDDFQKALDASGLAGQFSQADLQNARTNPDFGMSMLAYKTDYANATTPEARALANQGAENLRSSLFGYTGGGDGGSFKLDPMSPRQFDYGAAPSFADNYADRIESALQATQNREPYSYAGAAPEYQNRYDPQIQQTIAGILGRGEFSYDPKTDPVYSAYQKQYAREGQRATANAMGEAAAMTGGMPSSWAMTAASQAGDYYASQMADKIPELYQDAYNRYLQEYQMKLSDLSALRGLESDDYRKYQDQLAQYNADRNFDYAAWLDSIELGQKDLDNLRALRSDDLALYQTQLGQYNTDRSFDYGQWLDEIQNQRTREQDAWSQAETAAKYGDYSRLNAKGVDTSSAEYADLVARGVQAAQYGDYSLLNQAGINTDTAQFKEQLALAADRAAVGDYSGYAALGIDTSNAQLMDQLNIQAKQASIASTYANMPTAEEKALELAYKQAQIDKMNRGDSGSGTGGMSASDLVDLLTLGQKTGNTELYNAAADALGLPTNGDAAVDSYNASQMKLKSKSDLTGEGGLFDDIREMKAEGYNDFQTQDGVKSFVMSIPGYDDAKMGDALKDFLAELFGRSRTGGTNKPAVQPKNWNISAQ